MIKRAAIGGRRLKNDNRDIHSWIGALDLRATCEGQQYVLAALHETLWGKEDEEDDTRAAWEVILTVSERKAKEYCDRAGGNIVVIEEDG